MKIQAKKIQHAEKKLKILKLTEFSSGICGVWERVKQESIHLAKNHEVYVFSSNVEKGTDNVAKEYEEIGNVKIYRFPAKKSFLTKNVNYFDFDKKFNEINPDIVITHLIHPHSFKALRICLKKNIPCFIVTHAPFNVKRNILLNLITKIYYYINVNTKIKKFTKIIAITKWEQPYLLELGCNKDKIAYIPNGIPEEFFKESIKKFKAKKIIFLGRIAPVKNLETLIKAFKLIYNEKIELELIGPIERGYERIKKFEGEGIRFLPPIYELSKKIKKLNEADIFVLPSKREAMPQALIEAMALGKIVISSSTDGGKEIINNGVNGFIFEIGDEKELAERILWCLNKENKQIIKKIQKNARETAKEFQWSKLIKRLKKLIQERNEK